MRATPYLLLLCSVAAAAQTKPSVCIAETSLPRIIANNNRIPAGHLHDGVLAIGLEARTAIWYPEKRDGPGLQVQAFGEPGRSLEIPGPLIRVPEGTEINVAIRNRIPGATLIIHGLHTRPGNSDDAVQVAPRETREIRFKAGEPGTYYYWATTTGMTLKDPRGVDSQLTGGADRRSAWTHPTRIGCL